MLLENKRLVVIGGTSGLGLSGARGFVEAGAQVIAVGRQEESVKQAQEILGKSAHVFSGDATDPAVSVPNRLVTDALVDALTLVGTPARVLEQVTAMREAGARRVALYPAGVQRRQAVERFVGAVMPRIVGAAR